MIQFFKYVRHSDVETYESKGWAFHSDLGAPARTVEEDVFLGLMALDPVGKSRVAARLAEHYRGRSWVQEWRLVPVEVAP